MNVVTGLTIDGGKVRVTQEFSGGLVAHLEADLPLVVGVQASREAPRYAAITRVRQAMTSGKLETVAVAVATAGPAPELRGLAKPQATTHAEMIDGSVDDAATRLAAILQERGFGRKQG